jgi:hypothetical protein
LLTGLFLLFIGTGCTKKDTTVVPSVTTLTMSASPNQVQIGGYTTIVWKSNGTSVQIMEGGEVIASGLDPTGQRTIGPFTVDTKITVEAMGENNTARQETTIKVIESLQMKLSLDSDTPTWDSSVVITVQTYFADSVKSDLPGFKGVNGTFSTPPLKVKTVYHFTAYGLGKIKSDSVVINVAAETNTQKLTNGGEYGGYRITEIDTLTHPFNTWGQDYILPCMRTSRLVFKTDGTFHEYQGSTPCWLDQPNEYANGHWHFVNNETQIDFDGTIYTINKLTLTELDWETIVPGELRPVDYIEHKCGCPV